MYFHRQFFFYWLLKICELWIFMFCMTRRGDFWTCFIATWQNYSLWSLSLCGLSHSVSVQTTLGSTRSYLLWNNNKIKKHQRTWWQMLYLSQRCGLKLWLDGSTLKAGTRSASHKSPPAHLSRWRSSDVPQTLSVCEREECGSESCEAVHMWGSDRSHDSCARSGGEPVKEEKTVN